MYPLTGMLRNEQAGLGVNNCIRTTVLISRLTRSFYLPVSRMTIGKSFLGGYYENRVLEYYGTGKPLER